MIDLQDKAETSTKTVGFVSSARAPNKKFEIYQGLAKTWNIIYKLYAMLDEKDRQKWEDCQTTWFEDLERANYYIKFVKNLLKLQSPISSKVKVKLETATQRKPDMA